MKMLNGQERGMMYQMLQFYRANGGSTEGAKEAIIENIEHKLTTWDAAPTAPTTTPTEPRNKPCHRLGVELGREYNFLLADPTKAGGVIGVAGTIIGTVTKVHSDGSFLIAETGVMQGKKPREITVNPNWLMAVRAVS